MKYHIDLGSGSIKIYQSKKKNFTLLEEKEIGFEEYFVEEEGISRKNYRLLMLYIKELTQRYELHQDNCKIYATGIWRKISKEQYEMLRADFSQIGLKFNVICLEEEIFYFETAMQEIYDNKKVLLVNVGSKTTEIMIYNKGNMVTKKKLSIGVSELMNRFPTINKSNHRIKYR